VARYTAVRAGSVHSLTGQQDSMRRARDVAGLKLYCILYLYTAVKVNQACASGLVVSAHSLPSYRNLYRLGSGSGVGLGLSR